VYHSAPPPEDDDDDEAFLLLLLLLLLTRAVGIFTSTKSFTARAARQLGVTLKRGRKSSACSFNNLHSSKRSVQAWITVGVVYRKEIKRRQ
jgi:hypothetical protein